MNFHYQKQTKRRWARDDPAFLVLLSGFLLRKSVILAIDRLPRGFYSAS